MEISEEAKKNECTPDGAEEAPERTGENEVPQSFSRKVLWWGVFAVLVGVSVAITRAAFPSGYYDTSLALDFTSGFDIPHFAKLLFSLAWIGVFFVLLKKFPLWVRGIAFVAFFLLPVFALYLRKYYGMEFGFPFFADCLNTNWQEARAFFSLHAIGTLVGFIVLMFVGAWLVGKIPVKLPRSKIFVAGGIAVLAVSSVLLGDCVFPVKITLDAGHYLTLYKNGRSELEQLAKQEDEPQEVSRVPTEISHVNVVPVVVLHVGETARADHAPFNGYPRNTMPNMLKEYEAGNLVSFPKCVSFAEHTGLSMRGMMSPSTVLDNAFRHPTFIPPLNQSGVETIGFFSSFDKKGFYDEWIGLLTGRMHEVVCTHEPALSLLPEIREKVAEDAKKDPPQKRFYLYYGEGSHEPFIHYDYDKHAVFKPNGKRKYGDERDVNNYDNTFIATDEFCGGFIDALRDENAVYIFVGDHGTMLGEDGLEGRPFKRKEVRHVLFFIWASDKFKAENPELWATMVRNRERLGVVSHDFVYNSVLHLFSLKTPFYDEKADLFSESAEPFPTEMPEAEEFGSGRSGGGPGSDSAGDR